MELENGIYRSPSNFDSYVYYCRKEGRKRRGVGSLLYTSGVGTRLTNSRPGGPHGAGGVFFARP